VVLSVKPSRIRYRWDVVIMESDEELVAGDGRESQFDITEEYDGRVVTVGAFMLVGDV
jgi:hypothetical protein